MWGFTDALADAAADGAPALPSHDDGAYYFDLFWFMVRYSKAHVGPWLHGAAFLAVALLPVAVAMMYKRPVLHTCCAVADAMRRYLLAVGGAVVLPMLVGALRASVLGMFVMCVTWVFFLPKHTCALPPHHVPPLDPPAPPLSPPRQPNGLFRPPLGRIRHVPPLCPDWCHGPPHPAAHRPPTPRG